MMIPMIVAIGASPIYSFSLITATLASYRGMASGHTQGEHAEDNDEAAENGVCQMRHIDLEGTERHSWEDGEVPGKKKGKGKVNGSGVSTKYCFVGGGGGDATIVDFCTCLQVVQRRGRSGQFGIGEVGYKS
jgi:hypothetical protein